MTTEQRMDEPQAERLSPDDQASRTTDQLQEGALRAQQLRAAASPAVPRGVCVNCGEQCLPAAVYCDEGCRADHEARLRMQARQRQARG